MFLQGVQGINTNPEVVWLPETRHMIVIYFVARNIGHGCGLRQKLSDKRQRILHKIPERNKRFE